MIDKADQNRRLARMRIRRCVMMQIDSIERGHVSAVLTRFADLYRSHNSYWFRGGSNAR